MYRPVVRHKFDGTVAVLAGPLSSFFSVYIAYSTLEGKKHFFFKNPPRRRRASPFLRFFFFFLAMGLVGFPPRLMGVFRCLDSFRTSIKLTNCSIVMAS